LLKRDLYTCRESGGTVAPCARARAYAYIGRSARSKNGKKYFLPLLTDSNQIRITARTARSGKKSHSFFHTSGGLPAAAGRCSTTIWFRPTSVSWRSLTSFALRRRTRITSL